MADGPQTVGGPHPRNRKHWMRFASSLVTPHSAGVVRSLQGKAPDQDILTGLAAFARLQMPKEDKFKNRTIVLQWQLHFSDGENPHQYFCGQDSPGMTGRRPSPGWQVMRTLGCAVALVCLFASGSVNTTTCGRRLRFPTVRAHSGSPLPSSGTAEAGSFVCCDRQL